MRDVAGVGPNRVEATEDHVVDRRGIEVIAGHEVFQDVSAEVGRMYAGERTVAPADGRANRVDDVRLGHQRAGAPEPPQM